MGNSFALSRQSVGCCIGGRQQKVLRVVKMDGKVLEFKAPILVQDILLNFSGSGIGTSKKASEHLPSNYELKMGKVYFLLPSTGSVGAAISDAGTEQVADVKRIKVVITKQQLHQLLTKQISMEEVLSGLKEESYSVDSPPNWKPKLESIAEGGE